MSTDKTSTTDNMKGSLDTVKTQLSDMGSQIQSYLSNVDATIENYKFNVEQIDGGIHVDIAFKARVGTKE